MCLMDEQKERENPLQGDGTATSQILSEELT